jgi:4a-hydroxytetrahydrobiopterin dehydratase
VTDQEWAELKPQIPDWTRVERGGVPRLERTFTFDDFSEAMDFAVHVGRMADAQDHHPQLVVEWGKVTAGWWTHRIGGLHRNDLVAAAKTDEIYRQRTGAAA